MNDMTAERFSNLVREILSAAGWFPGRRIEERVDQWAELLVHPNGFVLFPAARAVLLEFGGLQIDQQGPGIECAREPLDLDPLLALNEEDLFAAHSKRLGAKLFPIGEALSGQAFLAISEDGQVFLVMDDVWFTGKTFDEALERLIHGIRSIPLDQWLKTINDRTP
jgi:hypothetical protein